MMRERRTPKLIVVAAILAAVAAVAWGPFNAMVESEADAPHRDGPRAADRTATFKAEVRVRKDQPVSRPIPSGFLGLSFEFPGTRAYTGASPRRINPVLEQLIRNLTPGQSPVLRIGGDSTDATWWPTRGVRRTPGISYSLTPSWIASTRALLRDLHARAIVGANLQSHRPALTIAEARALVSGLGARQVRAVEIGNEPSNYPKFPWYRVAGRAVYARERDYDFRDFTQELPPLRRALRGIPLAGPALGGYGWLPNVGAFLRAAPGISTVTWHRYPLNRCFAAPGSPAQATLSNLLAPAAAGGFIAAIPRYAAVAHARRAAFRLDELNSVSCSGKSGLSDTFASALWALDALFEVARAGVDGVNIHTFPGAAYELFAFHHTRGRWSAWIRPEYYGLLLFIRAAPPGARLLRVSTRARGPLKSWATRSSDGRIRVVLINKALKANATAAVQVSGAPPVARLERLSASNALARGGVTLAGQTFSTPSLTGRLTGRRSASRVSSSGGVYSVRLTPASAALLTIATPKYSRTSR
jgi:hypothetical protein